MADQTAPVAPVVADYRKITDALAGALDRLAEKRRLYESAQVDLQKATEQYTIAQQAAADVDGMLKAHLMEVLPSPNRRP